MPSAALFPDDSPRQPRRCRGCHRPVPVGPTYDGYGSSCAGDLGLIPRAVRLPKPRTAPADDEPNLLDLLEGAPMSVEMYRKRPIEVETMLWDGTQERADAIREWVGRTPAGQTLFLPPEPVFEASEAAELWNTQERCWIRVPVGHRIVKGALGEFHPISPEAVERTYERVGA